MGTMSVAEDDSRNWPNKKFPLAEEFIEFFST